MRFSGIYAIIDSGVSADPLGMLDAVMAAGIRLVQYRSKTGVDRRILRAMLERARPREVRLVVNDDLDAAMEADGWHAGQEDLAGRDLDAVRTRLGSRIFGISAALPQEARVAEAVGADYVGAGPFAATATKGDAGAAIGAEGIARVVEATRLPVVAIGGIDVTNLDRVAASGAAMAAVISAITNSNAPEFAARALVDRWRALGT
jgi:thiamine-phosphate pyrophosphorylase